jgi:hypothetical protein
MPDVNIKALAAREALVRLAADCQRVIDNDAAGLSGADAQQLDALLSLADWAPTIQRLARSAVTDRRYETR